MKMGSDPEVLEEAFCGEILESRAAALVEELSALKRRLRDNSIHDTRVASRRMRAVLEAFKDLSSPRPWSALYNRVREVTRSLGKVRETDVNLLLLKDMTASGDMAENLCREYLLEQFQRSLRANARRLKRKLRKLDGDRIRAQTDFLLSGLGAGAGMPEITSGAGAAPKSHSRRTLLFRQQGVQPTLFQLQPTPGERGRRILLELSQPVLKFRPRYDFRRATDEQLHEMRIAAKKLRYAMEIFDSVWPGGLKGAIALARDLQDAGGQYHDWCVLRDRIQAEIRRLTKQETTHLAFQMGRLLAQIEDRRLELRKKIAPAIKNLQSELRPLLPEAQPAPKHRARVKVHQKTS